VWSSPLAAWTTAAVPVLERVARTYHASPWPAVAESERRVTERVRASLPDEEFTAQVAAGRTQSTESALAQALSTLDGPAPAETW